MAKNVKKRNWAFVVYPTKQQLEALGSTQYDGSDGYGSAPDDWRDILQETGLQCCVSPLHDKDLNPDGKVKKPHYHVIVCYSGPTSFNVVLQLTEKLTAPNPQALEQVKGYYRYLTHKDNPEKYQYDEKEITCINGFNILDFAEMTRGEIDKIKVELHRLIIEKDMMEYNDLMQHLLENEMWSEYSVASSNTIFFNYLLRSRRHSAPDNSTPPLTMKEQIELKKEAKKKMKKIFKSKEDIEKNNLLLVDDLAVDPDSGEVIGYLKN